MPTPSSLRHDAPRIISIGSARIRVCLSAQEANGHLEIFEFTAPPGAPAPPLHTHRHADETFHILEGTLHLFKRDEQIDAGPGMTVHVRRGTPHRFVYPSPGPDAPARTRFLSCFTPALNFDKYFEELAILVQESYPPDKAKLEALLARFDHELPLS